MQRNILVDLNVILDVLLERPDYKASQATLEKNSNGYTVFISEHIVTTLPIYWNMPKFLKKK